MDDAAKAELIKGTTEIVKTAYEDAFQPVAQEAGKALGTVGKTVNVALAPLRGIVWGWDRIEEFIEDKVSKKLEEKGVEEEDIITPDPDIAVPTVEALRYSKLKDEFATLLASAMNSKTANDAHPAFVDILKQMSILDAKIMKAFGLNRYTPILRISKKVKNSQGKKPVAVLFGGELASLQLSQGLDVFAIATDNLERLGLIEIDFNSWLTNDSAYAPIQELELTKAFKDSSLTDKYSEQKGVLRLTEFGKSFKLTCT